MVNGSSKISVCKRHLWNEEHRIMSRLELQLRGYRMTTAEITYRPVPLLMVENGRVRVLVPGTEVEAGAEVLNIVEEARP